MNFLLITILFFWDISISALTMFSRKLNLFPFIKRNQRLVLLGQNENSLLLMGNKTTDNTYTQSRRIFSMREEGRKTTAALTNPILSFTTSSILTFALRRPTFASTYDIDSISVTTKENENVVVKKLSDEREYLSFVSSNGLRVLLISDKAAVRSAAAVDVHVGSFSDPIDLQGLAHFTGELFYRSHTFIRELNSISFRKNT